MGLNQHVASEDWKSPSACIFGRCIDHHFCYDVWIVLAQFHGADFPDDLEIGFFNGMAEKGHGKQCEKKKCAIHNHEKGSLKATLTDAIDRVIYKQ